MNLSEASKKIEQLRRGIWRHNQLYYILDQPEISDTAYDQLMHELVELEKKCPQLVTADSPTQRVGAPPASGRFATYPHTHPKKSLQDIFAWDELQAWEDRLHKLLPQQTWSYFTEPKVDGLNITISYTKGKFQRALTRGDGTKGEDVSHTVKTIRSLPLLLAHAGTLEVSGEVYLAKKAFVAMNVAQERAGQPSFANPRNAAAGTIRQLDPKVAAARQLDIIFYDLWEKDLPPTRVAMNKRLRQLGFKTDQHVRHCHDFAAVTTYVKEMEQLRHHLPYATDGAVIKVNEQSFYEKLGSTAKAPRWAVAFKFSPPQTETKVLDIIVQVGRTGALTPVAVLEPVQLSGSTVTRATLHNEEEIARKDVRVGDTVTIHKAGEIIPEILAVNLKKRPAGTKSFRPPTKCPICGAATIKPPDEVVRRCSNKNCAQQQLRFLQHFVSRVAFDMEGLGPKLLAKLLDEGLITTPADLFLLKREELLPLERLAEKSADNIVRAIQQAKTISLDRFLYALGIRHVGDQTAADLARFLEQQTGRDPLETLAHLSVEEIAKVPGIGQVVATSIQDWLTKPAHQHLLQTLHTSGVQIKKVSPSSGSNNLTSKTFVFTGTMATIDRSAAETLVRQLGGKTSGSVSKKTDYVVAGTNPGSKYDRARALSVKILDETAFKKMVGL